MKRLFILIISAYVIASAGYSQDIIINNDGEETKAKVVKITSDVVEYYKYGRTDGPLYSIDRKDIFMIKYPDGSKDVFKRNSEDNSKDINANKEIAEDILGCYTDERDSVIYEIVRIGDQRWMAKNLKYKTDNSRGVKSDAKCGDCGRYYTFEDAKIACPEGWHLPSDNEWIILETELGMSSTEARKSGWRGTPPGQASKLLIGGDSKFDAGLCGGIEQFMGYNGSDYIIKYRIFDCTQEAYFWTSSVNSNKSAWIRHLKIRASIERTAKNKSKYFNVRCVRD